EGGSAARLMIQGVELLLQLPADSPADDWSLFAMHTGQAVQLSGCVLTVEDGNADHSPIHDRVAMIGVRARRAGDMMPTMDPQLMMLQQASVELSRCIVRGESDVIRIDDETPLRIFCEQSLIATSRRFLDTGGSDTKPKSFHKIEIDLDHVTAR